MKSKRIVRKAVPRTGIFTVYTVEHCKYIINAKTLKAAKEYLGEVANLDVKDPNVTLLDFGYFKVLDV